MNQKNAPLPLPKNNQKTQQKILQKHQQKQQNQQQQQLPLHLPIIKPEMTSQFPQLTPENFQLLATLLQKRFIELQNTLRIQQQKPLPHQQNITLFNPFQQLIPPQPQDPPKEEQKLEEKVVIQQEQQQCYKIRQNIAGIMDLSCEQEYPESVLKKLISHYFQRKKCINQNTHTIDVDKERMPQLYQTFKEAGMMNSIPTKKFYKHFKHKFLVLQKKKNGSGDQDDEDEQNDALNPEIKKQKEELVTEMGSYLDGIFQNMGDE